MEQDEPVDERKKLDLPPAVKVLYCGECGYPAEYCEFGPDVRKCIPWLKKHDPTRVDSEEKVKALVDINDMVHKKKAKVAPAGGAGEGEEGKTVEGEGDKKKEEEVKKAEEAPAPKKKSSPKVIISRSQRSKRKFLTVVTGLDAYQVASKEACSAFKKKFACGVSQVKGTDEIEIQGDVTYEIAEFIAETWPQISPKNIKFGDEAKGAPKK